MIFTYRYVYIMSMSTLCFVVKSAVELVGFLLPVMLYAFVCSKRMWVLWTLYTLYWLMHVIHVNRLWGGCGACYAARGIRENSGKIMMVKRRLV